MYLKALRVALPGLELAHGEAIKTRFALAGEARLGLTAATGADRPGRPASRTSLRAPAG
jgi:hypothetical protein